EGFEQAPFEIIVLGGLESKALQTFFTQAIDIEYKTDLEGRANGGVEFFDLFGDESFFTQRLVVDGRRAGESSGPYGIFDDGIYLLVGVTEVFQRGRHGLIDDLEIAAAGQFLELDEGKVGLNAGGIAIHDQADRTCRSDNGSLCIAVAVFLAQLYGFIPGLGSSLQEII